MFMQHRYKIQGKAPSGGEQKICGKYTDMTLITVKSERI